MTATAPEGTEPALLPREATVAANGIEIAYQPFGDPSDPALLLVMGLGTQMIGWPDELCEALADAGRYVIRFDNRDVGRSTHIGGTPPSLHRSVLRRESPYKLDDMAADAHGLLDALDIERCDVVGASMGGMISQIMAISRPERVRTLTLVMTSTGSKRVGRPALRLLRPPSRNPTASREQAIEESVATWSIVGSQGHLDLDGVRRLAGIAYDRAHDPAGFQRQLSAILAQTDRTAALRRLDVPTLVVHGLADPLVTPSGGLALARAIPGARFVGHHGMAHDLPSTKWQELVADIQALQSQAPA